VQNGSAYGTLLLSTPGLKDDSWWEFNILPYWVNTPAMQAMNAAVDKYDPGLGNNPQLWQGNDAGMWTSGLLLTDAVKAGGLQPGGTPSPGKS
jgi:branched-chain amino acid transport system substrate-binding protein